MFDQAGRSFCLPAKLNKKMLKKYIITFRGNNTNMEVVAEYQDNGALAVVNLPRGEDPVVSNYLVRNVPGDEANLGQIGEIAIVEECPQDLHFPTFWEAYGNKMNRERALKLWSAMPDDERLKALRAIPRYNYYLSTKPGIEKKYPDTWLKNKCWQNNYTVKK